MLLKSCHYQVKKGWWEDQRDWEVVWGLRPSPGSPGRHRQHWWEAGGEERKSLGSVEVRKAGVGDRVEKGPVRMS